jgi:hypothetical protein
MFAHARIIVTFALLSVAPWFFAKVKDLKAAAVLTHDSDEDGIRVRAATKSGTYVRRLAMLKWACAGDFERLPRRDLMGRTQSHKWAYALLIGAGIFVTSAAQAADVIRVAYAGSMGVVMDRFIGPASAMGRCQ